MTPKAKRGAWKTLHQAEQCSTLSIQVALVCYPRELLAKLAYTEILVRAKTAHIPSESWLLATLPEAGGRQKGVRGNSHSHRKGSSTELQVGTPASDSDRPLFLGRAEMTSVAKENPSLHSMASSKRLKSSHSPNQQ